MVSQPAPVQQRAPSTTSPATGVQSTYVDDALDKSEVAELSMAAIDQMTCDELKRVILAADFLHRLTPNHQPVEPTGDRETLLRLAHLARRCCQHQGY